MASRCLRIHLRWWHAYHSSINLFIIEELNIRTVNGVYDAVGSFLIGMVFKFEKFMYIILKMFFILGNDID